MTRLANAEDMPAAPEETKTTSEEELLRDLILEEFFAQASGADIYDRIPTDRLDKVCSAFLDKLTPDGMCARMSNEFGEQLRKRMPAPKGKSDKPFKKTLNLSANRAHGRAHSSQH